jgi:hypothetical protein
MVLFLQGSLNNINLFQVITIMALFMLLPVSILVEGLPALPENLAKAVSSPPPPRLLSGVPAALL